MTDTKFIDFDAFRAEQTDDPVQFRIGGVTYELSSTLPASIAVDVIRMKSEMDDEDEVDPVKLMSFCGAVFGTELWAKVLDTHRLTLEEMPKLLEMILEAYTSAPKVEAESPTSVTTEPKSD